MTRLAVVGPGRAGSAVAVAALRAGYAVTGVAGRSRERVDALVARLPGARPGSADDVTRAADVVVLAVPDDALETVARRLAVADVVTPGQRWLHLAGSRGIDVLRPLARAGARTAACHPAQTLTDAPDAAAALAGCAWAVTAAPPDRGWAHAVVEDMGGVPVDVADHDRTLYHLATTLAANGTSAVVSLARDLLLGIGIPDPRGLLVPLARAAVEGAAARGPAALTGPVRRGDASTVTAHLDEIDVVLPEARDAYVALARLALRQAVRAGLDAAAARRVADVLDETAGVSQPSPSPPGPDG